LLQADLTELAQEISKNLDRLQTMVGSDHELPIQLDPEMGKILFVLIAGWVSAKSKLLLRNATSAA